MPTSQPHYRRMISAERVAETQPIQPAKFRDTLWDTGLPYKRFEPRRLPKRIVTGCAAVILVAGALISGWMLMLPGAGMTQRRETTATTLRAAESLNGFTEAKRVLHAFTASEDTEQRLACVRHPELTRGRMHRFETCWETLPLGYRGITGAISSTANGGVFWQDDTARQFLSFEARLVDGDQRTVWFELTPTGPKLDWESLVFYEDIPWVDFTQGHLRGWVAAESDENSQVYRLHCETGDYYNLQYADSEKFAVFKVDNPARAKACWAYTWRDSEIARKLVLALNEGNGTARVTLKLRGNLDGSPDQLWIDAFVSPTWIHDAR